MTLTQGQFEALGTTIYFEAPTKQHSVGFSLVQAEAERIEQHFSRFRKTSALSQLNQKLQQWVELDAEFIKLLEKAQQLTEQTEQAFDIGVHQALEHWGYDADYNLKTDAGAGDFTPLELGLKGATAKVNTPIDFGGFGKGYLLDRCATLLAEQGVDHYLLNAGGDLGCRAPLAAEPWTLHFEDPRINSRVIGEMKMQAGILCSSSPSRRQWGPYHHLVDPESMEPSNAMSAVYVQHPNAGLEADALSTSFFVMGYDRAQKQYSGLAKAHPGLEVMLMSADGQIWRSANFEGELYTAA